MRLVLDTSALISALVSPSNTTGNLLGVVLRRHRFVVSPAMAAEYASVLMRPRFDNLGAARLARLQDMLSTPACLAVRPLLRLAMVVEDESDNRFIEATIWSDAKLLISGDPHLLALKQLRHPWLPRHVDILSPRDALTRIAG